MVRFQTSLYTVVDVKRSIITTQNEHHKTTRNISFNKISPDCDVQKDSERNVADELIVFDTSDLMSDHRSRHSACFCST